MDRWLSLLPPGLYYGGYISFKVPKILILQVDSMAHLPSFKTMILSGYDIFNKIEQSLIKVLGLCPFCGAISQSVQLRLFDLRLQAQSID